MQEIQRHVQKGREGSPQRVPVHSRHKVGYCGVEFLPEIAPAKRRDSALERVESRVQLVSEKLSEFAPVDLADQPVQAIGQLLAQVLPVDLGQKLVGRFDDRVDAGAECAPNQVPVDAVHKTVENAGDGVYGLSDLRAQVLPGDQLPRLFKRLVDAPGNGAPDAFIIGLGPHFLQLSDKISDSAGDLGGLVGKAATGSSAAATAAASAVFVVQYVQFVESRELAVELLDLARGPACGAASRVQPAHGPLIGPLPGQSGDKRADGVDRRRQHVDQLCQRRCHRRNNGREGRSQAGLQAVQSRLQAVNGRFDRRVLFGQFPQTFGDGRAQATEQREQSPDAEAIAQDRHKSLLEPAVGLPPGFPKSQHPAPRGFQIAPQRLEPADNGSPGQLRQLHRRVFRPRRQLAQERQRAAAGDPGDGRPGLRPRASHADNAGNGPANHGLKRTEFAFRLGDGLGGLPDLLRHAAAGWLVLQLLALCD